MMTAHEAPEQSDVPEPSFLEKLADQLELTAHAQAVFGTPVERDGTTVIPVAKARLAMGGGWGARRESKDAPSRQTGTGGGGAAIVKPLGFIELVKGNAKYRAIRDPALAAVTLIAAGLFALSAL